MSGVGIGQRPQNRRQRMVKSLWTGIWLVYLSAPVTDLLHGGHSTGVRILGWLGLAAFVCWYMVLVFRTGRGETNAVVLGSLAVLATQSAVLSLTLGREWLVLFVYVSIASGAALPLRWARWTIPAAAALLTAIALAVPDGTAYLAGLLIPALLGGFAMTGVRELVRTTIALREARATVAQLAANEERLRLARDLHDLLGHSLSLITLKSELAGRLLPDHPDKAAQQVTDIENVSRQALVDVREAVSGYRRPRLAGELAGAEAALTAAGVLPDLPAEPDLTSVPEESESALAWALREAVTNVVRHSGARRCVVGLVRRQTLDGPVLELSVEDDGPGGQNAGPGNGPGNGLTGLAERLAKAGGSLEAGVARNGFRVVARVPTGGADGRSADDRAAGAADGRSRGAADGWAVGDAGDQPSGERADWAAGAEAGRAGGAADGWAAGDADDQPSGETACWAAVAEAGRPRGDADGRAAGAADDQPTGETTDRAAGAGDG